jgi:hypothetical protein
MFKTADSVSGGFAAPGGLSCGFFDLLPPIVLKDFR